MDQEGITCRHCGLPIRLLMGTLGLEGISVEPWTTGAVGTPVSFLCGADIPFRTHEPLPISEERIRANLENWIAELAG